MALSKNLYNLFYTAYCRSHWIPRNPEMHKVLNFRSEKLVKRRKPLGRAAAPWVLDSGGYTINRGSNGDAHYVTSSEYFDRIQEFQESAGQLTWAGCQDRMCSPKALKVTGGTVQSAQRETLGSFSDLRYREGNTRILPILQGWELPQFLQHVKDYLAVGHDLTKEPVVGLGSLGGNPRKDLEIIRVLHEQGIRLHAFGASMEMMQQGLIFSADSARWSYDRWKRNSQMIQLGYEKQQWCRPSLPGCSHTGDCCDCIDYAQVWRDLIIDPILFRFRLRRQQEMKRGDDVLGLG